MREIDTFSGEHRFLSNFYSSPIVFQGRVYATAEHLYQALKTTDKKLREKIRLAITPRLARKIGRAVKLNSGWDNVKDDLMCMVVMLKFSQNNKLRKLLLNTEMCTLIEGNYWHDNHWGDCTCSKCSSFEGKNRLGEILMQIRTAEHNAIL